ncbi:MAG: DegV family protein [Anaerolineaceae bacterium]|nr:DegV family protein [Anaerolineaceae bacterium]
MQIVTDRGMDLAPEQMAGMDLHFIPLKITLNEKSYDSGVDISSAEFYKMLDETKAYPTTSQPSAGDFAKLYQKLAAKDPEILSIHISSGLSGTMNAAVQGAKLVPEAKVTFVDTKTLSTGEGWQVQAAALALKAGWKLDKILTYLKEIRSKTDVMFTLDDLSYLIHGGRISHLKGLLGSLLQIKPIIRVDEEDGKYVDVAKGRTFKRAIQTIARVATEKYGNAGKVRIQLQHGFNPEGVMVLKEELQKYMDCHFEPVAAIAPVLGAHTGPSLVGLSIGLQEVFAPIFGEVVDATPIKEMDMMAV